MTTWDLRWIGCGDKKEETPRPAIDLYLGTLFEDNRKIVEHTGSPVDHILSAQHVVLPAFQVTAKYENRLPRNPRSAKSRAWGAKVISFLKSLTVMPKCILVLAGSPYIDCWIRDAEALSIEVDDPLRGMELRKRCSFAKRFVAETPKAPSEPREVLLAFLNHFKRKAASLQTGMMRWAECFYTDDDGVVQCVRVEVEKKMSFYDIQDRALEAGSGDLSEIHTDEGIWTWDDPADGPRFQSWEQMIAQEEIEQAFETVLRSCPKTA